MKHFISWTGSRTHNLDKQNKRLNSTIYPPLMKLLSFHTCVQAYIKAAFSSLSASIQRDMTIYTASLYLHAVNELIQQELIFSILHYTTGKVHPTSAQKNGADQRASKHYQMLAMTTYSMSSLWMHFDK